MTAPAGSSGSRRSRRIRQTRFADSTRIRYRVVGSSNWDDLARFECAVVAWRTGKSELAVVLDSGE